jgi:N-acetylglucosamine-6-phosphate deacetylase
VEAVQAASSRSAALLTDPMIGRIQEGGRGDLVLLRSDLREGALTLDRVLLVAKGGVVFVRDGKWIGPRS